jgi:WD40 repeat protein
MKNNIYSLAKGLFLDDKKCKLNKFYITSKNYKTIYYKLYQNHKLTENRNYEEEIFPQIIAIKCISPKNLKIFTNKNIWYNIKISNHDNKPIFEEKSINLYQNNSSRFSPSFPMSISNTPFIIYNNEKYIIKGGFWDSHLEINSLYNEHEKKEKEKEKEEKISINIFVPQYGPIEIMKMTSDEKLLFCGTKYGNTIIFEVNGPNLKINKVLYDHSDYITSININETLNMFATSSKDGYINIYILPSFSMIRSVLISNKEDYNANYENIEKNKGEEYTYASNIFLSSTPLPCYTIYINEKHIFKTFSINGEFIYKEEESETTGDIKCCIIFKNLYFNDFLIYGTEDGFVKIRSFPDMILINAIKPFEGQEIKALELSPDKRFCYVWSHKDKIAVIKDINTSTGFEVKDESGEHEETLNDKVANE